MNKRILFLLLIGFTSLYSVTPTVNVEYHKTVYDRCILFAKGLGTTCVGLGSLLGAYYWIDRAKQAAPLTDQECEDALREVERKNGRKSFISIPPHSKVDSSANTLKRRVIFGSAYAAGAGVLYTNYRYILPRAFAYFKQALAR